MCEIFDVLTSTNALEYYIMPGLASCWWGCKGIGIVELWRWGFFESDHLLGKCFKSLHQDDDSCSNTGKVTCSYVSHGAS